MTAEIVPLHPKPTIKVIAGERHHAADQAIAALMAAKAAIYQRNFALVSVAETAAKNADGVSFQVPGIVKLTLPMLGRGLGQAADFSRYDLRTSKDAWIDPPTAVAQQILAMVGEWPFPYLSGLIQCPTLRRDGSLLDTSGYDERTGLVLINTIDMPPMATSPSREDAEAALELLTALLDEFPFADEASRAVALSMIITPVLRAAMAVAPMHLVTAPVAGTGKSYLADIAAMIATGDRCAVEAMAPSYEETEKRLVGSALAGFPIIGLDNCRDVIAGDFFCQIVERPLMSLRGLGKSDKHRAPNTFTMFCNGNNTTVAADMVRRTLRCAMDANLEHPETREFAGNPLAAVQRNRGQYVAACLTIARAYISAGRPQPKPPLASFEGWSQTVREPLIWLGCADPVNTIQALRQEDPAGNERYQVFDAWKTAIGINRPAYTSEIIAAAGDNTAFRDALKHIARQRFGDAIDPKAFGKWLSANQNNIGAACKLMVDRKDKSRPKWYLELQGTRK